MDIKTTFLNVHIQKEICLQQMKGFVACGENHKVCKLDRSIYSLKQASRNGNIIFVKVVKLFDFLNNEDEPYVYKRLVGEQLIF